SEESELRKVPAGVIPAKPDQDPEETLRALKYKHELAQQQRPWPRENLLYRRLLLANIVLLIILLSNSYAGAFDKSFFSSGARGLANQLCAFCSRSARDR